MLNFENKIVSLLKNIDKRFFICLLSSLIVGLISHSSIFLNYIYIHDGIWGVFGVGATVRSGRWSLWILKALIKCLFNGKNFSLPLYHGILCIIFISVAVYIVVKTLDIQSKILCVLLSSSIIAFPLFSSLFNFMFTAPYYTFGFFLAVLGPYIFFKYKNVISFFIAATTVCFSIGIYQALFPVSVSFVLLFYFKNIIDDKCEYRKLLIDALVFFLLICFSAILYFLALKVVLLFSHISLTSYRGIDTMGLDSINNYIVKIKNIFTYFLFPHLFEEKYKLGYFHGRLIFVYYITLLVILFFIIRESILFLRNKQFVKFIILFITILCMPISFNLIILMTPIMSSMYSFMMFGGLFYLFLLVFIFSHLDIGGGGNMLSSIYNVCINIYNCQLY